MKDQTIKSSSSHPKEEEALKTVGRGFAKTIALLLIAGGMLVELVTWRYFLPEQYIGTHGMALLSILLGLAGWVVLERRRKQPVSKILIRLAVRLAVLFGVLAGIVFGVLGWVYAEVKSDAEKIYSEKKFDRDVWLESHKIYNPSLGIFDSGKCICGKMYDDLKKNYLKEGMSLTEVRTLLGGTTHKFIFKKENTRFECLQYGLGGCEWAGGGTYLMICFDQNNKLRKVFKSGGEEKKDTVVDNSGVKIHGE